jgi:NhaP-type Na+/H+ and K+/H+ antiporter
MVQEKQQNQQIKFTNLPKYQNLTDLEKQKFQLFITSIIKLKRDTLKLFKKNPEIDLVELPHYLISENTFISFSVKKNSWMLDKNFQSVKFNPTLITGVNNFLKNIDLINIQEATNLLNNDIENLFIKYELNDN